MTDEPNDDAAALEEPPTWEGDPERGRWCSRCQVTELSGEPHKDGCPGPAS